MHKIEYYDILDLVDATYLPFGSSMSDDDINESLKTFNFLYKKDLIYKGVSLFQHKPSRKNDVRKVATIVNEILKGTYDYNYAITIWRDEEYIDFDDLSMYHVRAFHFCNQNIPVIVRDYTHQFLPETSTFLPFL